MSNDSLLQQLREQVNQATDRTAAHNWGIVPSGISGLDDLLPAQGLRCGTLVEWLSAEQGSGATTLALAAARSALTTGQPLVIVDSPERRDGRFHPPGVDGIANNEFAWNWRHVLLVRAEASNARWAIDQALRTSGVGAVLFRMDYEDERWLRRWQLAAERSGAIGLIVRRLVKQPEACFADIRFLVTPVCAAVERRVRLQILRCRQGSPGTVFEVTLQDVAHSLPPVSASTDRRRTGT